jgi:hypothetical protein
MADATGDKQRIIIGSMTVAKACWIVLMHRYIPVCKTLYAPAASFALPRLWPGNAARTFGQRDVVAIGSPAAGAAGFSTLQRLLMSLGC